MISFPRDMPATGVARQVFEPQRVDYGSPENGGRNGAMAAGFPLWLAEWTLGQGMGPALSDEWRGWLASLRGAGRQFYGRDVGRPYPKAYLTGFGGMTRAGGGAFDGSTLTWSQTIGSDGQALLDLTGLPAALQLGVGDYVGFRWETEGQPRRALVRALEAQAATGGGAINDLSVEPPATAVVPPTAVAYLNNPVCLMRLVTSGTKVTPMDRRRVAGATITALQDLLP